MASIFDPATHNDLVSVAITIQDPVDGSRGFSTVMFISSDSTLGGTDRVRSYASPAELDAALEAGTISVSANAAGLIAFGQAKQPDRFLIGRKAGGETWADAYALCVADSLGVEAYGICIQSRTDANILAIAAAVETEGIRLFGCQANNSDLLSGAMSSASLADLADYNRTILYYHTSDSQWLDVAHMVDRLAYDPDTISVPWNAAVEDVAAYTGTAITQTQKAQGRTNNVNLMLPFGTQTDRWVDKGYTGSGLPVSEQVTADWFSVRLRERWADLIVALSGRGEKLPVTAAGQAMGLSVIEALIIEGITAGHFVDGQYTVAATAINATDLSTGRLRFTGAAQYVTSARTLSFSADFTVNAVVVS